MLESFEGINLFVREVRVEWRSSHSCIEGGVFSTVKHVLVVGLSLSKARKLNCNIWVAGDFNLPKMDWDHMCPSPDC